MSLTLREEQHPRSELFPCHRLSDGNYELGLIFETYHTILNVNEFYFGKDDRNYNSRGFV